MAIPFLFCIYAAIRYEQPYQLSPKYFVNKLTKASLKYNCQVNSGDTEKKYLYSPVVLRT